MIIFKNISVSYGGPLVLDHVNLQITRGERVCLIGKNGEGKSTLIRLINGDIKPDDGQIIFQQNLKITCLPQEIPRNITGKIFDIVAQDLFNEVEKYKINAIMSKLSLNENDLFESLSGGLKRRVLLAKALALEPDILLLDEPTNHLDLDNIIWLENFLLRYNGTLLFVTHDQSFLQKLATRIIELDRGQLTNWKCDYQSYLQRKQKALVAQETQNAEFDKKLAQEENWIRQGVKARRTRDEGRVRKLKKMREERRARRELTGKANLQIQQNKYSGKLVIETQNISFCYDDNCIIKKFSSTIMRNDKIGIIGPNGSGKTTLLRLLLGEIKPQQGSVHHGTQLEIAYFDQLRAQIDENKTLRDNVGGGSNNVIINGKTKHIIGYLQDFLFSPERANTPVKVLSGGERNRLLLAKLFLKQANVLVLDEPTNDLDIDTLNLLESLLVEYTGTVLLVSHDRTFLNNVVTSIIAFEDSGQINEYVGGYDDWLRQKKPIAGQSPKKQAIQKNSLEQKKN